MKFRKNIGKIRNATEEELGKLEEEYEALMENVRVMSSPGLLTIAVIGIAIILFFRSGILDFIGLVLLLYPLYIFVDRGSYREGYFEGYYNLMTKSDNRDGKKSA